MYVDIVGPRPFERFTPITIQNCRSLKQVAGTTMNCRKNKSRKDGDFLADSFHVHRLPMSFALYRRPISGFDEQGRNLLFYAVRGNRDDGGGKAVEV